jgi:hypothetical protein
VVLGRDLEAAMIQVLIAGLIVFALLALLGDY